MLRQITDGFSLDTKLLPLVGKYRAAAVAQLEVLRRAGSYQCQWLVVPQESSEGIPAYGQIEYQASVMPGSWIWGYSLQAKFSGSPDSALVHVHIEDEGTGQYLVSDYEVGNGFSAYARDADDRGKMPVPIIQIFPVTPPGHLNVKIANQSSVEADVQLVLNVARICQGRMLYPQECLP